MAKGYMYVAPAVQPQETFADKFSKIGQQMSQAQQANQAAMAQRMQALRKQRNAQLSQLMAPLKNTDSWSRADIDELNSLIAQSKQNLISNPEAYPDLLMAVYNYASQGKSHSRVRTGLNNEEEQYVSYMNNEREWPVDGYSAVTSAQDFRQRADSYDNMFVETGDWTDPSTNLVYTVGDYLTPGKNSTMKEMFAAANEGAEISYQQDPNTGITKAVAIRDGQPIGEAVVSGPLAFHPGRGSAEYFTPDAVNTQYVSPEDEIKNLNNAVVNLRGQIQSRDIQEPEARARFEETLRRRFRGDFGQGQRSAAMDMWNDMYAEEHGEYDPAKAQRTVDESGNPIPSFYDDAGVSTPEDLFVNKGMELANLTYKAPSSTGGSTRINRFNDESKSFTKMTGLPTPFETDAAHIDRRVLYQGVDQDLQAIGSSLEELKQSNRVHIHIPGQRLLYNDRKFQGMEAYLDAGNGVIMLEKADGFEGKPSSRATSNRWSENRVGDENFWNQFPERKYEIISIYENDGVTFTQAFIDLSSDFDRAYSGDANVDTNTLLKVITEKSR